MRAKAEYSRSKRADVLKDDVKKNNVLCYVYVNDIHRRREWDGEEDSDNNRRYTQRQAKENENTKTITTVCFWGYAMKAVGLCLLHRKILQHYILYVITVVLVQGRQVLGALAFYLQSLFLAV